MPRGRQRGDDLFGGAFANRLSFLISSQTTDTKRVYFGLYTSVHPANYITAQCGKEEVMSQVLGGKTLVDFSQTALTNHSFFFYSTSLS